MRSDKTNTFQFVSFLLYALVSATLLWHHEPWRDEMQCWEIARQSASLPELFHNARYEGHPSAWYLVLFAVTRFTAGFAAVQWLHWLFALASVALVLWRSPFGRWQRALLVFGYFFLFEYGVLTRNYAIGLLLALAVCSLMKDWRRHWFLICTLLFVLMQCSMFALLLAAALAAPLFFQGMKACKKGELRWQGWSLGSLVLAGGLLLSAYDMTPPPDTAYAVAWKWAAPDWRSALGGFFRAMLPLPPWEMHGWGHHVLEKWFEWKQRMLVESIGAGTLLIGCVWSLRKSPFAVAFFGLAWLGISLFLAVKFSGYIRHHGHFFLAYLMALWMKTNNEGENLEPPLRLPSKEWFFALILLLQFVSVMPMAYFDLRFPFSQSRMVADFLRQHHLEDRFIVGDYDYATSPVAFHLRRPIYYPNQLKSGTFIFWNKGQAAYQYKDIVPVAMDLAQEHGDLLLLTSYPISAERLNDSVNVIQAFYPAIEGSEEFYLYQLGLGK